MDELLVGTLLPGATRIDVGNVNPVWRGNVLLQDYRRQMYIKQVPPRTLAVEIVCALMGRALGLPVPRPAIVLVSSDVLPGVQGSRLLFFGSESVDNPDLKQWMAKDHDGTVELLMRWSKLLDAGCFDELIANGDRHGGNILFNGNGKFVLIDHSEAMQPYINASDPAHQNVLLQCAAEGKQASEVDQLYAKAREITYPYSAADVSLQLIATLEDVTQSTDASGMMAFLDQRIHSLMMLISDRIGYSQAALVLNK